MNIADIDGSPPKKRSKGAKPEIIIIDSDSDDGCGADVANLERCRYEEGNMYKPIKDDSDSSSLTSDDEVFESKKAETYSSGSSDSNMSSYDSEMDISPPIKGRNVVQRPNIWPETAFDEDGIPLSSVFKTFVDLKPMKCDKSLPYDIDGLGVYVVPIESSSSKEPNVKDGRPWEKSNPTKWAGFPSGSVRFWRCKGNLKCSNVKCLYWIQFGHPNTTQFEMRKDKKYCAICEMQAQYQYCDGQKYAVFLENSAVVCHKGKHTCTAIEPLQIDKEEIKNSFRQNPKLTASQLSTLKIAGAIREGKDWDQLDKEAVNYLNRKMIANLKQSATAELYNDKDDFIGLRDFKKHCDKRDKFYVYKINSRELNPNEPNYVFKTSKTKVKIAMSMCQGSGHEFLEDEPCFFDGKSLKLRKGLKTLTLSVYHPLLRKQLPLAIMDCEAEDTQNITIFWNLLNECIQIESGNSTMKFDPCGFCLDMAGCNRAAGVTVFGQIFLQKIKSCEFHFKQCRNRHRQKLTSSNDRERFTKLTDALLDAHTVEAFEDAHDNLRAFLQEDILSRGCVESWVDWWYKRKDMIFQAFTKHVNAPKSNLAEVIHASWENSKETNLSLMDACAFDVKESYELDLQFQEFERGNYRGGTGPSAAQRAKKRSLEQQFQAERYAEQIFAFSTSAADSIASVSSRTPVVDPTDSHRADKRNQKAQKKDGINSKTNETRKQNNPKKPNGQDPKKDRETRFRGKRSQIAIRKISSAKKGKNDIKIKSFKDTFSGRVFEIMGSKPTLQKDPYTVSIGLVPQCTCIDFLKNSKSGPCKHIIWLYLYVFKIDEEDSLIHQTSITSEELTKLLAVYDVDDAYIFKDKERNLTSRYQECKKLLREDARFTSYKIEWKLIRKGKKRGRDPQCPTCKATITVGMPCLHCEALYVPYEQQFIQEKDFFFCAKKACVKRPPFYTNIVEPSVIKMSNEVSLDEKQSAVADGLPII